MSQSSSTPSSLFTSLAFQSFPVIGIFRGYSAEDIFECARVSVEQELPALEVTMNTPGAPEIIEELVKQFGKYAAIGAGTVCTLENLEVAHRSGVSFIVTPIIAEEVLLAAKAKGLSVFCGAYTPTEIHRAWTLGADCVKIFPGQSLGPGYIQDVRGPFPEIRMMPTGGVTLETVGQYRKAGAAAYGLGSALYDKTQVKTGNWKWVAEQIQAFRKALS